MAPGKQAPRASSPRGNSTFALLSGGEARLWRGERRRMWRGRRALPMERNVAGEPFCMKRECTASERRRLMRCCLLPSAPRRSDFVQASVQGHAVRRHAAVSLYPVPLNGERHRLLGLLFAEPRHAVHHDPLRAMDASRARPSGARWQREVVRQIGLAAWALGLRHHSQSAAPDWRALSHS
jgi:hypothetical protein